VTNDLRLISLNDQLEHDARVMDCTCTILANAAMSARLAALRHHDTGARKDIKAAVERLDAAMDSVIGAIELISTHLPSFTPPSARMDDTPIDPEPHGARDPIGPSDMYPECPACGNSLPLDADCRCSGCGNG
jgi:hypothetical protein